MRPSSTLTLLFSLLLSLAGLQAFAQGPVAAYHFNTCTGTTLPDSVHNLNGTVHGAFWSKGYTGQGLTFDGVNDYVQIPDNDSTNFGTHNFTVAFWVKKLANSAGWHNSQGVDKWNTGGYPGTNEWSLSLGGSNDNYPKFNIESGTTNYQAISNTALSLNVWYQITGVRDSSQIKLYLNGSLVATQEVGNVAINNTDLPLYIGRIGAGYYSNAVFDELKIYNRALSATEISDLANVAPAPEICDGEVNLLAHVTPITRHTPLAGGIALTATGGDAPYRYSWSSGESSSAITGKGLGAYMVTVSDSSGRSLTRSYQIGYGAQWKNLINVTIGSDGSLARGSGTGFTAGASSYNELDSASDGWMEFTANAAGSSYMLGLATGDPDASYKMAYSIYVREGGDYQLRKDGSPITGGFTSYAPGTVFRISREGSYIRYYADGVKVYELASANQSALIVDASIAKGASPQVLTSFDQKIRVQSEVTALSKVGAQDGSIALTATGGDAPYRYSWSSGESSSAITGKGLGEYTVTVSDSSGRSLTRSYQIGYGARWKNLINVTVGSDGSLARGSGTGFTAGASSYNELDSASDGWMEFTANAAGSSYMLGLATGDPDASYKMAYSIYVREGGDYQVRKNGSPITGGFISYAPGTVFRISREGSYIRYYADGVKVYELASANQSALIVDASIAKGASPQVLTSFQNANGMVYDALELQALRNLYDSTDGPNWTDHTGWPATASAWDTITSMDQAAGWYGVVIKDGDVSEIQLKNNHLVGNIPASIGDLQALTKVYLGEYQTTNQLSGTIPIEVTKLKQVTHLVLAGNQLTGSIPSKIFQMPALQYCVLSSNQLSGNIPTNLGDAPQLINLILASNKLTGPIPESIGQLVNCRTLYLSNNDLSGEIPKTIGQMSSLGYLNLIATGISGEIPVEIGNCTRLGSIYLNGNNLTGEIPLSFGKLANLKNLNLRDNKLIGSIPDSFANLENLQNVNLTLNHLTGIIPEGFTKLKQLSYLSLFLNNFTSFPDFSQDSNAVNMRVEIQSNYIPQADIDKNLGLFSSFTYDPQSPIPAGQGQALDIAEIQALRELYENTDGANWTDHTGWPSTPSAWDSIFTVDQVAGWYGVTIKDGDIYTINLDNNQLKGTIPTSLGNLGGITILNLKGNQLSGAIPASLGNLRFALQLNLERNTLTGAIPNALGGLASIHMLVLAHNNLTGSIPSGLGELSTMLTLDLSYNQLSGDIPAALSNLTALQRLYLYHNQLSGTIPSALSNLPNLWYLELQNNQLSGAIPKELGKLNALKGLYLSHNQLSGTIPPEIGKLSSLQTLHLNNNQLTGSIPSEIGNLNSVKDLRLQFNQLIGPLPATLGDLQNLSSLYVHNNALSGTIPASIGKLPELEYISVTQNNFTGAVPAFSSNSKIKSIQVLFNPGITALPDFSPVSSLNYLYVKNTKLSFDDLERNQSVPNFYYSPQENPQNPVQLILGHNDTIKNDRSGGENTHYQWQMWDGMNWINISGASDQDIVPTTIVKGDKYRCEMTNTLFPDLTLYSSEFTVDVVVEEFYVSADGDWSDPSIWADASGSPRNSIPAAHDVVHVEDGHVVQVYQEVACGEVMLNGDNPGKVEVAGGHLIINGTVRIKGLPRAHESLVVNNGGKLECK